MSHTTPSFGRVLVGNRGEIACRAMRTLRDLRIESVAVFSDADKASRHVRMADQAVHLGPAPATQSYLDVERVLDAAIATGCQAVFPGYGFLSENAEFARACEQKGLTFIGPRPSVIEIMGDKVRARQVAEQSGVVVVPGGPGDDLEQAKQSAASIGYPLLLKASAGGGGKGMRRVESEAELIAAFEPASREAQRAFGNGQLYVEKAVDNPRHVEVQLLGDQHGNCLHLFERDCSIQRRHQKIIEETPCPALDEDVLRKMTDTALALARAVDYSSAGTVEFLLADNGEFYFLEMNTRLQVEHPITELVTGLDLVELMLSVAAGNPLPLQQADVVRRGHALECRLYAEDPAAGYLPRTGTLELYREAAGPFVRVDGGVLQGSNISSDYDPLLAKICSWGSTRAQALSRLRRALVETKVSGVVTNLELLRAIVEEPAFERGEYDTSYLEARAELRQRHPSREELAALAAGAHATRPNLADRYLPAGSANWWQE